MIRNSRNISPIETLAAAEVELGTIVTGGVTDTSLMALGLVPLEPIDHARFGHTERKPILYLFLQRYIKLRGKLLLLFGYVLSAIELDLEGELSHERLVLAACAPQRDVAFGNDAFSEVELTKRQEHLLN